MKNGIGEYGIDKKTMKINSWNILIEVVTR